MSNAIKWALLAAGAVALVALVFALPISSGINVTEFSANIDTIIRYGSSYIKWGRGVVNIFLTPTGRTILSGVLYYLFGKWAILTSIKITTWVYHFVFRG